MNNKRLNWLVAVLSSIVLAFALGCGGGGGDESSGGSYTIIASYGPNGTISPSGTIIVYEGGSQTFTITPDTGYGVEDVLVDGFSVGPVSNYEFDNIIADHTIHVTFEVYVSLPPEDVSLGQEGTTVFEDALKTQTPEQSCQTLVSFLQGKPNVAATGISDDGRTAWLRFVDGGTWAWSALPEEAEGEAVLSFKKAPLSALSIEEDISHFPTGNKAYVLATQWPGFSSLQGILTLLSNCGYNLDDTLNGAAVTPRSFKYLGQYDLIFINTHGGIIDGKTYLATKFSVDVSMSGPVMPPEYEDDYQKGRLIVWNMLEEDGTGAYYSLGTYLLINSDYLSHYCGNFRKNAGIFIKACYSLAQDDMASTLVNNKGAGMFFGFEYSGFSIDSTGYIESLLYQLIGDQNTFPKNIDNALLALYSEAATYVGDPEWGLIPHLHSLLISNGHAVELEGSFGEIPGSWMLLGSEDSFPISPENWSEAKIFIPYDSVPIDYSPPSPYNFFVVANGIRSNPFNAYVTKIFSDVWITGGEGTPQFNAELFVYDPLPKASNIVVKGPGIESGIFLERVSSGHWFANFDLPIPPPENPKYELTIQGDPAAVFSAQIDGYFLDGFPIAAFPRHGSTISEPLTYFGWVPSPVPISHYGVHLFKVTGEYTVEIWKNESIPDNVTTISYEGPSLEPNTEYFWLIHASHPITQNLAGDHAHFRFQEE